MLIRNLMLLTFILAEPAMLSAILYDLTNPRIASTGEARHGGAPLPAEAPPENAGPFLARYELGAHPCNGIYR